MKNKQAVCEEGVEQSEGSMLDALLLTYAEDRAIIIDEESTPKMIRTVVIPLLRLDADEDENPIDIYLNTMGGEAITSLAICDAIDSLKCPTTIHVLGCAYSGGLWIASAGRHNPNVKKIAYPNAEFMYHRLSTGFSGNMTELEIECERAKQTQRKLENYLLAHTAIDEKMIRKYKDQDWFFDAKTALKLEIVNEVL
jgi:ATP-dependent Clp protease protease subunit